MARVIARIGFEPALWKVLRPRVERLGYLGESFQCAAHQPDALISGVGPRGSGFA